MWCYGQVRKAVFAGLDAMSGALPARLLLVCTESMSIGQDRRGGNRRRSLIVASSCKASIYQ